ncbi:ribosomal protein L7/L12 C-terminal domain-containing protein, partial [Terfezia claveryi]
SARLAVATAAKRSTSTVVPIIARRWQSTAPAADPKIGEIVDRISKLTLLETADLVALLKSRLNIPDMALASFSAGIAPSAPGGAAAAPAEEVAEEPVEEKTMFNVRLMKFETASKPKVIKEVKSLLGLSLVDSKKFVEAAPKMLKEGLTKDEAEKLQKLMKDLGAEVVLE